MFQKIAPLIILAMFAIGAFFMIQGMDRASKMSSPDYKSDSQDR
jgi:hypothetical protein